MLEKIRFINHINEEIKFGENGVYANYNDLRDYTWNPTILNSRISGFSKGVVTKTIPVVIHCESENAGITIKNRLMEFAEKDILAKQHGKIIIGDYYLKAFITGSKKSEYLLEKGYMKTTLTLKTDFPDWIKETVVAFRTNLASAVNVEGRNLDYNYDFPYDFTSGMVNKKLVNTGFVGTNFKMIFYGPVVNPTVHVAGHTYQVNCEVGEGEYLTVDSLSKTIVLTKNDGTQENKFNYRNRDSYVFEKIPAGDSPVTWDGGSGFDVILLEERSEPKWT